MWSIFDVEEDEVLQFFSGHVALKFSVCFFSFDHVGVVFFEPVKQYLQGDSQHRVEYFNLLVARRWLKFRRRYV